MDAYEFSKRLGDLLRSDQEHGRLGPLDHYQAQFPGHAEEVSRGYAAVTGQKGRGSSPDVRPQSWLSARDREHYTHRGEIARGGMGAILRVHDATLDRDLAMKVILGDAGKIGSSSPATPSPLARRFLEEARITARLDHPGVVPVHEVGADGEGRLFFTMKLVKGGRTLERVLSERGAGDPGLHRSHVVHILIRVLETLAFAHEKGIIHRDLKPTNVMVGDFGEVYVMDWGLAKVVGAASEPDLPAADAATGVSGGGVTEVGQILGTPAYMPLEQARGEPLDARADIYAVGAMLYEGLSGIHPYGEGGSRPANMEVLFRLMTGPPDPLGKLAPDAPPELVSIAEKAMAREKRARYSSAMECAADLRSFTEGRVVNAHETGAWAELRKWLGRNRALALSLAAASVLLVAGLLTAIALGIGAARGRDAARYHAYRADIGAAAADLANRDMRAARLRLDQTPEDLRGWEWHHLVSRLDESLLTMEGTALAFSPEGRLRVLDRRGGVWELELKQGSSRLLATVPELGTAAWVTEDGEYVCSLKERRGIRSQYELRVHPIGEAGQTRTTRLGILDRKWDRGFRMPRFVYISTDNRLHLLDLATGADRVPAGLPTGAHLTLTGSSWMSRYALLGAIDRAVVYDLQDERPILSIERPRNAGAASLALTPDLTRAVIGAEDGSLELWDLDPGRPAKLLRLEAHQGVVQFVSIHPSGTIAAAGGVERSVSLHSLLTGRLIRICQGHLRPVEEGRFTPDGEYLLTRDAGGEIRVWAADEADPSTLRGHASYVYAVAFSPDGSRVYSGGWDGFLDRPGALKVWDASTGSLVASLEGEGRCVFSFALSTDGRRIVTVGGDGGDFQAGNLRVFSTETGRIERELPGRYRTLALHPDGIRAVVTDFRPEDRSTGVLVVVDLRTGASLATLLGKPVDWNALNVDPACSPDGRLIAGPGADGRSIVLWDAQTYREVRRMQPPGGGLSSIAFSRDGARLLTTAADDSFRVWEVATGAELGAQAGTGNEVLAGVFTTDGMRIVTGGRDRNLRIWDAWTCEEIVRLSGHDDYVKQVAASPDGQGFASASGDGTVRLWQKRSAQEIHRARAVRERFAGELTPRVLALFEDGLEPEQVAEQLRSELEGRRLEVALQIALRESVSRLAAAADDGLPRPRSGDEPPGGSPR
jgi:WD40 repeat protein